MFQLMLKVFKCDIDLKLVELSVQIVHTRIVILVLGKGKR